MRGPDYPELDPNLALKQDRAVDYLSNVRDDY